MLSPESQSVIASYLRLPIGVGCVTPYFNNRRAKIRAGLRALIGKGSPREIVEEAEIIALRQKVSLTTLDEATLKRFLVDVGLGIDCSGLAYHILDAESRARTGSSLSRHLSLRVGFFRRLIARLRPAEQVSVRVLAHDANSLPVKASDARPGDILTLMSTEYDHVLLIEHVTRHGSTTTIGYIHAFAWPTDGVYGHGVRRGTIEISGDDLPKARFEENGITVNFAQGRSIEHMAVRRLRVFQK